MELDDALDIDGLTGLWRYHRDGEIPSWCATVNTAHGLLDTRDYRTPGEALEEARRLSEKYWNER